MVSSGEHRLSQVESGEAGTEQAVSGQPAQERESRRLALLKRAGLFGTDTKGAVIRQAVSDEDLAAAYTLVHDAFVEKGYIAPQPKGLRLRVTEALPHTATFIAEDSQGAVVGVQSTAVDSGEFGLPSDGAFREEIDRLRAGGRKVCEATNQAVAVEYRKTAVPTELMRCMFAHAMFVGCDELITTVSPGHARFFELLGFEQISPVRSYSDKRDDPVVVVRVDVRSRVAQTVGAPAQIGVVTADLGSLFLVNNPYSPKVVEWADEAAKMFGDPAALRRLFVTRGNLLDNCSEKELAAIRQLWGVEVFDHVFSAAECLVSA